MRVADEDQVPARVRNSQDVGQRHLRCLVHEQHVNGIHRLRPGPQPSCSGRHLAGTFQTSGYLPIVPGQRYVRWRCLLWVAADLADRSQIKRACLGSAHHLVQKIGDDFWTTYIGLGEQVMTTKNFRRRFFSLTGRVTRKARRLTLHLPQGWPWQNQFSSALARLRVLPLPA